MSRTVNIPSRVRERRLSGHSEVAPSAERIEDLRRCLNRWWFFSSSWGHITSISLGLVTLLACWVALSSGAGTFAVSIVGGVFIAVSFSGEVFSMVQAVRLTNFSESVESAKNALFRFALRSLREQSYHVDDFSIAEMRVLDELIDTKKLRADTVDSADVDIVLALHYLLRDECPETFSEWEQRYRRWQMQNPFPRESRKSLHEARFMRGMGTFTVSYVVATSESKQTMLSVLQEHGAGLLRLFVDRGLFPSSAYQQDEDWRAASSIDLLEQDGTLREVIEICENIRRAEEDFGDVMPFDLLSEIV